MPKTLSRLIPNYSGLHTSCASRGLSIAFYRELLNRFVIRWWILNMSHEAQKAHNTLQNATLKTSHRTCFWEGECGEKI